MPHDHHHDEHDHTEPPSDLELRVKALESLLVEKGLVIQIPSTLSSTLTSIRSGHVTEHMWSPRPGPIPSSNRLL